MEITQTQVIEPVFMTIFGGILGAVPGGIIGMVIAPRARSLAASLSRIQYARVLARESSAFFAAYCGIESAMRGIRGKNDSTNQMVSGSCGGLAYSFVNQGFKLNPTKALANAAASAVGARTVYKVREKNRLRDDQDAFYIETRAMLSKLGLEEYEKNFKKGNLTDPSLPLLTDSDLQEVNIPQGARLLILDHIKRYNKMINRK